MSSDDNSDRPIELKQDPLQLPSGPTDGSPAGGAGPRPVKKLRKDPFRDLNASNNTDNKEGRQSHGDPQAHCVGWSVPSVEETDTDWGDFSDEEEGDVFNVPIRINEAGDLKTNKQ